MIENKSRKSISVLLILILLVMTCLSACGDAGSTNYESKIKEWDEACRKKGGITRDEPINSANFFRAGDSLSDWMIIAETRAGISENIDKKRYLKELKQYVTDAYKTPERLDVYKATEWHRIALVLLALGENPRRFAKGDNGKPVDLVNDGIFNWESEVGASSIELDYQGSNALIYSLLVIKAGGYESPEGARYTTDSIISMLVSYQSKNGSFGLKQNSADVDITAMSIQALAPFIDRTEEYINAEGEKIKIKDVLDRAVEYLSEIEKDGGYYAYQDHYSADTAAQVILALCAMGIDPVSDERFIKNGGNPVDALISFEINEGGLDTALESEGGGQKTNLLATRQGICALTALRLLKNGNGRFFDFDNKL